VGRGGRRKSDLDHVDSELCELSGDLQFLIGVQCDPKGLLAVSQRRIEYLQLRHVGISPSWACETWTNKKPFRLMLETKGLLPRYHSNWRIDRPLMPVRASL